MPEQDILSEAEWVIQELGWIRLIALILLPLELIISSYRIQFWHIWLPVVVFFIYLSQCFKTIHHLEFESKDCYQINVYPGMLSFDQSTMEEMGLALMSFIVILIVIIYILLWGFTFMRGCGINF